MVIITLVQGTDINRNKIIHEHGRHVNYQIAKDFFFLKPKKNTLLQTDIFIYCQPSFIVHSLVITKYIYIVKAKGNTASSDDLFLRFPNDFFT